MWQRLMREQRLGQEVDSSGPQKSLMNFEPTRPLQEVVMEFVEAFWQLYEPMAYLKRTFRHFNMMGNHRPRSKRPLTEKEWRLMLGVCWRQGIVRSTRLRFWWQLGLMALRKPSLLFDYIAALAFGEHFFTFRHEVRSSLVSKLEQLRMQQLNESENLRSLESANLAH
jgi:hypothetical protein